jgi:urease accessory protein
MPDAAASVTAAVAVPGADTPSQRGWHAELSLYCEQRGGRTVLARKRQFGPLTLQRPFYPEALVCHLYLLHPPGGVVGGDSLAVDIDLGPGARALVTTPGATKFYRSAGADALVTQRLSVAAGAELEWFPQEAILFPAARVRSRTEVALQSDARFIGWEILSLGRPVISERFDSGALHAGLSVSRDGRPLLTDRLRVTLPRHLDGPSGLRGRPVTGTFVATDCDSNAVQVAREAAGSPAGVLLGITLLDDLLVARCLAGTSEPVQRVFCTLWAALRPMLLGREACPPRIWAT